MHDRQTRLCRVCIATLALAAAAGCSRIPPPAADTAESAPTAATTDKTASDKAASHRKAIAAGAEAARAYARSRGIAAPPDSVQPDSVQPDPAPPDASSSALIATTPAERSFVHEDYEELDWLKMMPPEDIAALQQPRSIQHVGSTRMAQSGTFTTVAAVTGRKIKLPGYVVPIETDDSGRMTEFFFVPFFGACIHVPPPPPNQLVHAVLAKPLPTPQIWDPYWLRGVLRIETVKNKVAGSAYSMRDAVLLPLEN